MYKVLHQKKYISACLKERKKNQKRSGKKNIEEEKKQKWEFESLLFSW